MRNKQNSSVKSTLLSIVLSATLLCLPTVSNATDNTQRNSMITPLAHMNTLSKTMLVYSSKQNITLNPSVASYLFQGQWTSPSLPLDPRCGNGATFTVAVTPLGLGQLAHDQSGGDVCNISKFQATGSVAANGQTFTVTASYLLRFNKTLGITRVAVRDHFHTKWGYKDVAYKSTANNCFIESSVPVQINVYCHTSAMNI